MDMLGDAEPVDYESADDFDGSYDEADEPGRRQPIFTNETLAITAITLVLFSFFASALFQFLSFLVASRLGDRFDQSWQYAIFVTPSGVLAAVGAGLGWRVLRQPLSDRWLRGLAGAATLTGSLIALVTVAGVIIGFTVDEPGTGF